MTAINDNGGPLLAVEELCVTYHGLRGDVRAVIDLDFQIQPGEAVGLVGESGSGKSTVALALLGLLPESSATVKGRAYFRGKDLLCASSAYLRKVRGAGIGMIFQDPMTSLNPYLSVGRQVMETPVAHGMSRKAAKDLAGRLLQVMQMPNPDAAFKRFPHQYSGGMRQRTMAASAFSGGPSLLIADEPTTALDVITQDRVLRLMVTELRKRSMSLLLITHDLGIVAGLCDRVVVMKDGRAVEAAGIRSLYSSPQHAYTQALLRAVPRLDCDQRPVSSAGDGLAEGSGRISPGLTGVAGEIEPGRRAISVRHLTVEFRNGESRVTAVDDVSIDVIHGEVLGLVGQSGSGKSTLARAIAGLVRPVSGEVCVAGRRVDPSHRSELSRLRRYVQLVFQDPRASLNPRLTVERIVAEPLINLGIAGRREAVARARALMATVQLPPAWGERYPHELSGGQCQRVGIARALSVSPAILLCDEPVSALDVSIQAEILELLADLRRRLSLTMLFISHDLAVVRSVADRVAVMHEGRIVELKPADQLYRSAEHEYTRALLSAVPIPDPTLYRLSAS